MIGILLTIVVAALVYFLCTALGLPAIVAIIAAILVLLAGIPSGGFGLGGRMGRRGDDDRQQDSNHGMQPSLVEGGLPRPPSCVV